MQKIWSFRILAALLVAAVAQGCMVRATHYRALQERHAIATAQVEGLQAEAAAKQEDFDRMQDELGRLKTLVGDKDEKIVKLETAPRVTPELGTIWSKLRAVAADRKDVSWDAAARKLIVNVDFDLGRASVTPAGKASIKGIANVLKNVPAGYITYVDGHTDNLPVKNPRTVDKYRDNPGLAAARALAVCRVLAEGGVSRKLMIARSFGPYYPLVANADRASHARNRRVEISVVPADVAFTPTAMLVPESDVVIK